MRIERVGRETEFARRRTVRLGTAELSVVASENLILSKPLRSEESGSDVQSADIGNLLTEEPLSEAEMRERLPWRLYGDELLPEARRAIALDGAEGPRAESGA